MSIALKLSIETSARSGHILTASITLSKLSGEIKKIMTSFRNLAGENIQKFTKESTLKTTRCA